MSLLPTPSQTAGPFFHLGCAKLVVSDLAGDEVAGARVTIEGRILDGDGISVPDAMIEIWQANAFGKYAHPEDTQEKPLDPDFKGFGRVATDRNGKFRFTTIKPGSIPGPENTTQAPHLAVSIFMRGLMKGLATRIYFPNDPANDKDPIIKLVDPARRKTLIARESEEGALHWDVVMQGEDETVFFDI